MILAFTKCFRTEQCSSLFRMFQNVLFLKLTFCRNEFWQLPNSAYSSSGCLGQKMYNFGNRKYSEALRPRKITFTVEREPLTELPLFYSIHLPWFWLDQTLSHGVDNHRQSESELSHALTHLYRISEAATPLPHWMQVKHDWRIFVGDWPNRQRRSAF